MEGKIGHIHTHFFSSSNWNSIYCFHSQIVPKSKRTCNFGQVWFFSYQNLSYASLQPRWSEEQPEQNRIPLILYSWNFFFTCWCSSSMTWSIHFHSSDDVFGYISISNTFSWKINLELIWWNFVKIQFWQKLVKKMQSFFFAQKGHQFIFDLRNVKMKHADWLVHYVFSVYLANYLHICNCMCKIRFTS